jgi:hypothetical protein
VWLRVLDFRVLGFNYDLLSVIYHCISMLIASRLNLCWLSFYLFRSVYASKNLIFLRLSMSWMNHYGLRGHSMIDELFYRVYLIILH